MKNKPLIYTLVIIGLAVISLTVKGQSVIDDYGTKPPPTRDRQQEVVKYHIALELTHGSWTPEQRAILLAAMDDPTIEPLFLGFSDKQKRDVGYAIGAIDISKMRTIYKMTALADKKLAFVVLDKKGKAQVWLDWLAAKMPGLNREQQNALLGFGPLFVDMDPDAIDAYMSKVEFLFSDTERREIFGSIGPYTTLGKFCKQDKTATENLEGNGDCVCSVGHYNYSCYDTCAGGTGCHTTDGGCSIFWLRNCDGGCSLEPIIQ